MAQRSTGQTVDRLRHEIDSGATGDKIAAPDPAMAPLGTDDEAAGTPPSAAAVAESRRLEVTGPVARNEARAGLGWAWVLVAFIVVCASVFIVAGVTLG